MTNKRIIFLFIILLLLAFVSAMGALYYQSFVVAKAWYLHLEGECESSFPVMNGLKD